MVFSTAASGRKHYCERKGSFVTQLSCLKLTLSGRMWRWGKCQPLPPSLVSLFQVPQRRVKSHGWHQIAPLLARTLSCAPALPYQAVCLGTPFFFLSFFLSGTFHDWVLWQYLAVVVPFPTSTAFSLFLFVYLCLDLASGTARWRVGSLLESSIFLFLRLCLALCSTM